MALVHQTKYLKCRNGNVFIYYFGVIIEGIFFSFDNQLRKDYDKVQT